MSKLMWTKKKLPIMKNNKTIGMLSDECCCDPVWFASRIDLGYTSQQVVQTPNFVFSYYNSHYNPTETQDGSYNCMTQFYTLNNPDKSYWEEGFGCWSKTAQSITGMVAIGDIMYVGGSFSYTGWTSKVRRFDPVAQTSEGVGGLQLDVVDLVKNSTDQIFALCYGTSGSVKRLDSGDTWTDIGGGFTNMVQSMDCSNDNLYVATRESGETTFSIKKYSGGGWSSLPDITGIDGSTRIGWIRLVERKDELFAITNNVLNNSGVFSYRWDLMRLDGSSWVRVGQPQELHLGDAMRIRKCNNDSLLVVGGFTDPEQPITNIVRITFELDENGEEDLTKPIYKPVGQSKVRWFNCTGDEPNHCCEWTETTNFETLNPDFNPRINDVWVNANDSLVAGGGTEVSNAGGSSPRMPFVMSKTMFSIGTHVATYPVPIASFDNSACYAEDKAVQNSPGTATAGGTYKDVNKPQ